MKTYYMKFEDFPVVKEVGDEEYIGREVGVSHVFGEPDMPKDYPLPPLFFVCQINLSELPDHDSELPKKGMLYFFAAVDDYLHYSTAHEGIGMWYCPPYKLKVIYLDIDNVDDLVPREDYNMTVSERKIVFSTEKFKDYYEDHRLLGDAHYREWEDWDEPYKGWRVLFQLDSCEAEEYNINFVDCGVFNILISEEDLRNRNFDRVTGIVLST